MESHDDPTGDQIARLRSTRGPCPDEETLTRFCAGQLTKAESGRVQNHVDACGICDLILERMKQFDQVEDVNWPEVDQRLTRKFHRALGLRRKDTGGWNWLLVLACSIIVLLLYPAYRGVVGWRGLAPRTAAVMQIPAVSAPQPNGQTVTPAQMLFLDAVRGEPSTGSVALASSPVFVLNFYIPAKPGAEYVAEIADESGGIVATARSVQSHDRRGNFSLVCERRFFRPGRYVLTITETQRPNRLFHFSFSL